MTKPFLSAICVTCARVRHLENAIGAFLAQDYDGPKELVILNTCPRQRLKADLKDVRIINLENRPPSLGEARNRAVEWSEGTHLVTFDDDDGYLPHHLSAIAEGFATDKKQWRCDWIWLDKQFWGWGDTIKEIVKGQCPCFAYTKEAWRTVGGYPAMTVGEDRKFIASVTEKLSGSIVKVEGLPSFIYRWSNGVYHTSGQGDDTPSQPQAHDRYWADVTLRINSGVEPHGEVVLRPRSDTDWPTLAKAFFEADLKKKSMNDLCIVELGRIGDIINILPIARHFAQTSAKPTIMVSRHFSDVLEGVSYATAYPVNLSFHELNDAMKLALERFPIVIQCQIYGRGYQPVTLTSNFNIESWRLAGFQNEFYNPDWKLVFDRRNAKREWDVCHKLFQTDKPKVVTNLTRAVSAPLPVGAKILSALEALLKDKFEVVDIGTLRLTRIYDLIGVLEKAALLVTLDTSTLHLAAACDVPMIALVRDGWVGAQPRFRCLKRFTYSEVNRDQEQVVNAVHDHLCKS